MSVKRVLLVQCCNLPEWFYIWGRLQKDHPSWEIEGLAVDHPQLGFYLKHLQPESTVHFPRYLPDKLFDLILFPLVDRGHWRLRVVTWKLLGEKMQCDYQGRTHPLSARELLLAGVAPPHQPDDEFEDYLRSFPRCPLGKRIVVLESASPEPVKAGLESIQRLIPSDSQIVRVATGPFLETWNRLKGTEADSVVVFFTGEKGFFWLKALPFLWKTPRLLIFDESGEWFDADARSLSRFLKNRLLHGIQYGPLLNRVVLFQTEAADYLPACLTLLRMPHLFPRASVMVVCREEDREIAERGGADQVLTFSPRMNITGYFHLWREIRRFDPEVNAAVFTGRPVFWKSKLAFLLTGSRRSFVFNAQLGGYWLTLRTLPRVFRREPLLFGLERDRGPKSVVLFQTEAVPYVRAALERVNAPSLFPNARITLVCREEDRLEFEGLSSIDRLLSFSSQRRIGELWRLLQELWRLGPGAKIAIFTGRPVFRRAKLLFSMAPVRRSFVFNAQLDGYWLTPRTIARIFRREPLLFGLERGSGVKSVLLFQTEAVPYTRAALEKIRSPELFPDARFTLVCREKDRSEFEGRPDIDQVFTFSSRETLASTWRLLRVLRRLRPEVKVAVFTGRPVFRKAKLLFALAPGRRSFVLNAQLDGYWLTLRTLPRVFRGEPLLFGLRAPQDEQPVLLFQTEVVDYVTAAFRKLTREVFPGNPVVLVCRRADASRFIDLPGLKEMVFLPESRSWKAFREFRRKLRPYRRSISSALFTGRPTFALAKLYFLLFGLRRKLAFNAGLDAYWLGPTTWNRIFRREPLLFEAKRQSGNRVLLMESESFNLMRRAIEIVQRPSVVPGAEVWVFCRSDREKLYRELSGVAGVLTYSRDSLLADLRKTSALFGFRPAVKAVVLSGRPVFRKQKLLFWLIPTGSRLVFNHSLDCFYVNRHNFSHLLRVGRYREVQSLSWTLLLLAGKVFLFLPRFLFLLAWMAWWRFKRPAGAA